MGRLALRSDGWSGGELFDQLRDTSILACPVELSVRAYLLERLIVEKAGSIFRKIQLLTLDLFSEFPRLLSLEDGGRRALFRHTY